MRLGDVVGRIWPERAIEGLGGRPLVLVKDRGDGSQRVALDLVEAGVGARVIVVSGEPARRIAGGAPVDAVIVAIVREDVATSPKPRR